MPARSIAAAWASNHTRRGPQRSEQPPDRHASVRGSPSTARRELMDQPLPVTQADAVVIGAGAFGLSVAYQLATLGAGTDRRSRSLCARKPNLSPRRRALQTRPGGRNPVPDSPSSASRRSVASPRQRGFRFRTSLPGVFWRPERQSTPRSSRRKPPPPGVGGSSSRRSMPRACNRLAPYLTGRDIRSAYFIPGDIYIEEPRALLGSLRRSDRATRFLGGR